MLDRSVLQGTVLFPLTGFFSSSKEDSVAVRLLRCQSQRRCWNIHSGPRLHQDTATDEIGCNHFSHQLEHRQPFNRFAFSPSALDISSQARSLHNASLFAPSQPLKSKHTRSYLSSNNSQFPSLPPIFSDASNASVNLFRDTSNSASRASTWVLYPLTSIVTAKSVLLLPLAGD
jgi:hypothetical protein